MEQIFQDCRKKTILDGMLFRYTDLEITLRMHVCNEVVAVQAMGLRFQIDKAVLFIIRRGLFQHCLGWANPINTNKVQPSFPWWKTLLRLINHMLIFNFIKIGWLRSEEKVQRKGSVHYNCWKPCVSTTLESLVMVTTMHSQGDNFSFVREKNFRRSFKSPPFSNPTVWYSPTLKSCMFPPMVLLRNHNLNC